MLRRALFLLWLSEIHTAAAFGGGNTASLSKHANLRDRRERFYVTLFGILAFALIATATWAVDKKKGYPCLNWIMSFCGLGRSTKTERPVRAPDGYREVELAQRISDDDPALEEGQTSIQDLTEEDKSNGAKLELRGQAEARKSHKEFVQLRQGLLSGLFLLYVSCSMGFPYLNKGEASCDNGFFWEDHLPFVALLLSTKTVELMLYVTDPTIPNAKLEWMGFMLKFFPSILGYVDAYTDATAIIITSTCPAPGSEVLAMWMAGFYVVGVIFSQWIVAMTMACQDETNACLMKLIHMDAYASCVALPEEHHRTWVAVNLARTFLEDIPQAILQSIFVLRIKPNPFMLISVIIGVASSIKGVVDAIYRGIADATAILNRLREERRLEEERFLGRQQDQPHAPEPRAEDSAGGAAPVTDSAGGRVTVTRVPWQDEDMPGGRAARREGSSRREEAEVRLTGGF